MLLKFPNLWKLVCFFFSGLSLEDGIISSKDPRHKACFTGFLLGRWHLDFFSHPKDYFFS